MPRRIARRSRFLTPVEIEHLRELLIHLHDELGFNRNVIATQAGVNPTDLYNFTSQKKGGVFKTTIPRESFQRRILRYILSLTIFSSADYLQPQHTRGIEFSADPREDPPDALSVEEQKKQTLARHWDDFARHYSSLPSLSDTDVDSRLRRDLLFKFDSVDKMFDLLSSLGLATERSCKEISDALAGKYYAYRYSSRDTVAYRSYIEIHNYDIYSKVPKYSSKFKEGPKLIRETEGNIFSLGQRYIFIGLTSIARRREGKEKTYLGINLSVVHAPKEETGSLLGLYVSSDKSGDYNIGTVKFISTNDKYDEDKLGEVNLTNLPVAPEELAIDILEFKELLSHPEGARLLKKGKLARSAKYYVRRPRSRSQKN